MIKRNGDNVFAIASSNNQCQGARSAVSLCPGGAAGGSGAASTRIPRATAVRMTPPDAHHNTKEANIALSTYVEKWKNRYEDAERKHRTHLIKSEKGKSHSLNTITLNSFKFLLFIVIAKLRMLGTFVSYADENTSRNLEILFTYLSDYDR